MYSIDIYFSASALQPALKPLIHFIVEVVFSGTILTEEKSNTQNIWTDTQKGRHNDYIRIISDIYIRTNN